MAKAELKTKKTETSVDAFLDKVPAAQRDDSRAIVKMMERFSGDSPKMWGTAIIGFGSTRLKYDSGRELDWMKIGFSPRKAALTLYGLPATDERFAKRLGKHTTGKGCLYIKKLSDIDTKVLEEMIKTSLKNK
jgi:hypothetical protein